MDNDLMDTSPNRQKDGEGDVGDLSRLPTDEEARHNALCGQMTKLALDHAISIIFSPPLGKFTPLNGDKIGTVTLPLGPGKIESATGCVLQLQDAYFVVTAEHVLEGYETRIKNGEELNWQVGELRFDPLSRVVWRGNAKPRPKDIVFLRVSEKEANEACANRTRIISAPTEWPPPAPNVGQLVLLAGYPSQLREVDNGTIRPGPLSAMLLVTRSTGDGTFKCDSKYTDLASFDSHALPVEDLPGDIGGVSGGPVFRIEDSINPFIFVGVISQHWNPFGEIDSFVIEGVDGVPSSFTS
jgi:hypothetical protein